MNDLCIRKLASDERGSVAIVFALLVTMMFGLLALSVDGARSYNAQSRISSALDSAALAGAKALDAGANDAEVRDRARAYFDEIMAKFAGTVTVHDVDVQINRTDKTVTVVVDADMGTVFGGIIGHNRMHLDRTGSVSVKTRYIELAMALDVTGSMNDDNKLQDLKLAAKDVVKTLFDGTTTEDAVRIALVPWATSVNAGSIADDVSNNASTDQCVIERIGADEATDAAPAGTNVMRTIATSPYAYNCPVSPIVPLLGRSKESDLKTSIDDLVGSGGTSGHIGTAWGWYLVSPAWSYLLPTESKPRPYEPAKTIKNVLIMTDGEFNVSWKTTEVYDPTTMSEESYATFQSLCTNMKAQNVNVFTVGFGLTAARAIDELRNCATSTAQFYQAASGSDLKKAFKDIAVQIRSMRITH